MTPETLSASEPEPKGMGEASRLTGVFFEPTKTFEDIAARPSFVVPLILIMLFSIAYVTLVGQHIGWERTIRHQFEISPRAQQMPPEQREQAIAMQVKFASVGAYVFIVVGLPIAYAIWSGVLLGIVKGIMSAPVKFKQVFAAVVYGSLPSVLFTILAIAVMFMKNPDDFNMQNPLVFNPGAFLDPANGSKFVYSLASSLDLFMIWTLFLVGIGLKAAGGKRFSTGSAMTAVFLPWAIWILAKAALLGAFS
jgi:hypothetical protein